MIANGLYNLLQMFNRYIYILQLAHIHFLSIVFYLIVIYVMKFCEINKLPTSYKKAERI